MHILLSTAPEEFVFSARERKIKWSDPQICLLGKDVQTPLGLLLFCAQTFKGDEIFKIFFPAVFYIYFHTTFVIIKKAFFFVCLTLCVNRAHSQIVA